KVFALSEKNPLPEAASRELSGRAWPEAVPGRKACASCRSAGPCMLACTGRIRKQKRRYPSERKAPEPMPGLSASKGAGGSLPCPFFPAEKGGRYAHSRQYDRYSAEYLKKITFLFHSFYNCRNLWT
ncbi:hypothetical protein, partial [uncultured Mailhella sp.]|uniref:hypothetical protein n=1 Tax=uncultured Mailhella sp. TaxID=1981031 RepID=UPI0025CD2907